MKKTICIATICLIALSIKAQTEKGNFIIISGSNMSFIFGKSSYIYDGETIQDVKTQQISFEPSVGKFVADNIAVGLSIPITFTKAKYEESSATESSYGIAPFIRCYLSKSNIKPYINFDMGYLLSKSKGDDYDETYGGVIADGGIGVSAFISERVAFDTQLTYAYREMTYDGDSDLKVKTTAVGLVIGVTVTF